MPAYPPRTVPKPSTQTQRVLSPEAHARMIAGLKPFPKGVSGNPGGVPGRGGKASGKGRSGKRISPALMRDVLLRELRKDGNYQKLATALVKQAIRGNAAYLKELLARVMPVEGAEGGSGRVVFEGIKLELSAGDGGKTEVTLTKGSAPQALPPASGAHIPLEEPRDVEQG